VASEKLMLMNPVIEADHLTKHYDDVAALRNVSLTVDEGEIFGLIGPDGAGKTTLFRILTTLMLPDKGSARIQGLDADRDYRTIRGNVGYMPGQFSLYPDLTVAENLQFFATVFGTTIEENYDLVEDIYSQIEMFSNRRADALSGGMKQKLALSCALIHRPSVLFLDEPTTGVDPNSRKDLWDMLQTLKHSGITVFASTPYMDEAARCDRIAFLQNGEVLDSNTPAHIRGQYPHQLWAVKARDFASLITDLRQHPSIHSVFPFGEYLHVAADGDALDTQSIRAYLASKNYNNIHVKEVEPEIEDTFMALMQNDDDHAA